MMMSRVLMIKGTTRIHCHSYLVFFNLMTSVREIVGSRKRNSIIVPGL